MATLYHYCSNHSLYSIIENRSIWLSSLSLSSDTMEGKLVTKILTDMARNDGLDGTTIKRLKSSVAILEEKMIDGLGFCLSEEGDLLSQWRGYADDAKGVSIGFSKKYLKQLSKHWPDQEKSHFSLNKVEYGQDEQNNLIKPTYEKIKEYISKGAYKIPIAQSILSLKTEQEIEKQNEQVRKAFIDLSWTIFPLISKLFLLKTKAYKEEKEWRLISPYVKFCPDDCKFRPFSDRIIPYRVFKLEEMGVEPINEIIIGPKNLTPNYVIENLLNGNKFQNVKIKHSEASYR